MVKLTKRRERWLERRGELNVLKGTPLNPNASNKIRYFMALRALVLQMELEVRKEIEALYREPHAQEYFAQDASVSAQAKILTNALQTKFEGLFELNAKPIAESMADDVSKSSASSLTLSLKQLSGGLSLKTDILSTKLKDIVAASVAENVGLIKSIPQQYMNSVRSAVMQSITTGQGLKDLVPALHNQAGVTLRRARNIANDQTRKIYNTMNRGRMLAMGVEEFEWLHSGGSQHPRPEHIAMSGNIYRFDNLPVIDPKTGERGIPGQAYNCKCRMIPVVRFNPGTAVAA